MRPAACQAFVFYIKCRMQVIMNMNAGSWNVSLLCWWNMWSSWTLALCAVGSTGLVRACSLCWNKTVLMHINYTHTLNVNIIHIHRGVSLSFQIHWHLVRWLTPSGQLHLWRCVKDARWRTRFCITVCQTGPARLPFRSPLQAYICWLNLCDVIYKLFSHLNVKSEKTKYFKPRYHKSYFS